MVQKTIFSEIDSFIESNDDFLITSHFSPDGDNIGSCLAFYYFLKDRLKTAVICNDDPFPEKYGFLKESAVIFKQHSECTSAKYKNIIVLDTAIIKRTGNVEQHFSEDAFIVNIDHHITNELFGSINYVDSCSASASQLVLDIFKNNGYEISKKIADCLLTGILSDTGGFRYNNTDDRVFKDTSYLQSCGARVPELLNRIFYKKPLAEIRKINEICSKIVMKGDSPVAWVYHDQMNDPIPDNDPVLENLNSVSEAKVCCFVRRVKPGKLRISLRSSCGFDVSEFGSHYGGGGHKAAAGMSLEGDLESFKSGFLRDLIKQVSSFHERS